jgi:malonyl CoA-acyl carrier protein transacylase
MAAGRRQSVRTGPRHHEDRDRALRLLSARQRAMTLGRLNNTLEIPLTADGIATSTVVTMPGVRSTSVAVWEAQEANSMAQRLSIRAVCTKDTITITHLASALARTIRVAVFA